MAARLTIDGNGHNFGQDVPICADERGNAIERVEFEVLRVGVGGPSRNELNVELVGFRNNHEDSGSGIALSACACQLQSRSNNDQLNVETGRFTSKP